MSGFGKYLLIILAVWLGVFAYAKFGSGLPISSVVTQKTDLFTVSGEGKVTVTPDVAILSLGMSAKKNTVKSAQTEANTVVNNLTKAIKEFGVDDKDIKTTNFSVYPDYDNSRIVGYNVNINLTITIRNIDKVNEILDKATTLGANSIGGIQFTVDENKLKELTQEARKKAVEDAKTKAANLSSAAGMTLGKIVNIQEGSNNNYPRPMMLAKTEIQPGTTDITSTVTLFYETR
ncbi:SIMPL domain-containing protein [Candidatus Amesbacteria bacterium]|nr:SIMPL domain-containing protein [Candidatus Amesbacteria bacterium]